jgi:hypothetical protein
MNFLEGGCHEIFFSVILYKTITLGSLINSICEFGFKFVEIFAIFEKLAAVEYSVELWLPTILYGNKSRLSTVNQHWVESRHRLIQRQVKFMIFSKISPLYYPLASQIMPLYFIAPSHILPLYFIAARSDSQLFHIAGKFPLCSNIWLCQAG